MRNTLILYLLVSQVHYPLQPGPHLLPNTQEVCVVWKCALFGVYCEAIPCQINFLCDEAGSCGKGANIVISQLHYYFENYGLGK